MATESVYVQSLITSGGCYSPNLVVGAPDGQFSENTNDSWEGTWALYPFSNPPLYLDGLSQKVSLVAKTGYYYLGGPTVVKPTITNVAVEDGKGLVVHEWETPVSVTSDTGEVIDYTAAFMLKAHVNYTPPPITGTKIFVGWTFGLIFSPSGNYFTAYNGRDDPRLSVYNITDREFTLIDTGHFPTNTGSTGQIFGPSDNLFFSVGSLYTGQVEGESPSWTVLPLDYALASGPTRIFVPGANCSLQEIITVQPNINPFIQALRYDLDTLTVTNFGAGTARGFFPGWDVSGSDTYTSSGPIAIAVTPCMRYVACLTFLRTWNEPAPHGWLRVYRYDSPNLTKIYESSVLAAENSRHNTQHSMGWSENGAVLAHGVYIDDNYQDGSWPVLHIYRRYGDNIVPVTIDIQPSTFFARWVRVSPDGRFVLCCDDTDVYTMYSVRDDNTAVKVDHPFPFFDGLESPITVGSISGAECMEFSPDSNHLVAPSNNGVDPPDSYSYVMYDITGLRLDSARVRVGTAHVDEDPDFAAVQLDAITGEFTSRSPITSPSNLSTSQILSTTATASWDWVPQP